MKMLLLKLLKQQEAYQYLKTTIPTRQLKSIPYSVGLLDKLIEQRVTVINRTGIIS